MKLLAYCNLVSLFDLIKTKTADWSLVINGREVEGDKIAALSPIITLTPPVFSIELEINTTRLRFSREHATAPIQTSFLPFSLQYTSIASRVCELLDDHPFNCKNFLVSDLFSTAYAQIASSHAPELLSQESDDPSDTPALDSLISLLSKPDVIEQKIGLNPNPQQQSTAQVLSYLGKLYKSIRAHSSLPLNQITLSRFDSIPKSLHSRIHTKLQIDSGLNKAYPSGEYGLNWEDQIRTASHAAQPAPIG